MPGQDLFLGSPWMNAAGMAGYAPVPARSLIGETMGAFVTHPISITPRTPAGERCLVHYPGGVLLHSGLPNLGLSKALRKYGERWKQSRLPVWVHLFGSRPDEIQQMVRRLEGREGVMAIEMGLPPGTQPDEALAFVEAGLGELPLVLHLPLSEVPARWLAKLAGLGVSAVTLGAPRGMLPDTAGRIQSGRLYGPGLFPLMLAAVQSARKLDLPIIAGAGIFRRQDAQTLLEAGAWAVQLDTVLWRGWAE